jgi:hypothetical protein
MNARRTIVLVLGCVLASVAVAECETAKDLNGRDPVEVGFCEADAVFVGKVDARMETVRAYTPEGATKTEHYRIETSTVRVLDTYKSALPDKVTMIADLYDKKTGAFSFENGKEYLIFAKRLAAANEYAGASAKCSVQPTLLLSDAHDVRVRLEQHRSGAKQFSCTDTK